MVRLIITLVLLYICHYTTFSQASSQTLVDSLIVEYQQALQQEQRDRAKIAALGYEISMRAANALSDIDSFAYRTIRYATELKDDSLRINTYMVLARLYQFRQKEDHALLLIDTIKQIANNRYKEMIQAAEVIRAETVYKKGDWKASYQILFDVLENQRSICSTPYSLWCYSNYLDTYLFLGNTSLWRGDTTEAFSYYRRMADVMEKAGAQYPDNFGLNSLRSIAYGSMGMVLRVEGDLEGANENLLKALALFEDQQDYFNICIAYLNLGQNEKELKNLELAGIYFNKALDVAIQHDLPLAIVATYLRSGQLELMQKNYPQADYLLKAAIDTIYSRKNIPITYLIDSYHALYKVDSSRGNSEAALFYLTKYYEVRDSQLQQAEKDGLEELRMKEFIAEKEERLNAERQRVAAQQQKKQQTRVGALIIGLLLAVTGLPWLLWKKNIFKRKASQLKKQNKQLRKSSKRLKKELKDKRAELKESKKKLKEMADQLMERAQAVEALNREIEALENDTTNPQLLLKKMEAKVNAEKQIETEVMAARAYVDHTDEEFLATIRASHSGLSSKEEKLCSFLRLNLSNREIAALNGVTESAIRTARHRLKKKLNVAKDEKLEAYLQAM